MERGVVSERMIIDYPLDPTTRQESSSPPRTSSRIVSAWLVSGSGAGAKVRLIDLITVDPSLGDAARLRFSNMRQLTMLYTTRTGADIM